MVVSLETHSNTMTVIKKVAIFGASGNFGTPITSALVSAGFDVTIITRIESLSTFPPGIAIIKSEYTVERLTAALRGQDAAICVVGPAGNSTQEVMIDAAEAAGVERFIVNDFGWGPNFRSLPEFQQIGAQRRIAWERARELAEANPRFTYTGITIGNPIDWAIRRFPAMGFDIERRSAVIYDAGSEEFTGTTLEGIGQAVVGVLTHPDATANRFVKARSIQTNQNQLLDAFQRATGQAWEIRRESVKDRLESGRKKHEEGNGGWILDLLVYQLYEPGAARCIVAPGDDPDVELLEMREETPDDIVGKVLNAAASGDEK
ncbi:NAD(P)-binding protein [Durotheca rogersii]|uniref:NAD(P)-binding protein n=1 Tax=Durotheca rogersii TaxID=419775 RepID=UPI0022201394|nr:NAD(P)-binding protein [Durotheca rogersii]KAI5864722.1 NAD(P)-binding protein [Durotheca rogersii]